MCQIYAVREDNRKRVLVAIVCDSCDAEIKPGKQLIESDWVFEVWYNKSDRYSSYYCPECSHKKRHWL